MTTHQNYTDSRDVKAHCRVLSRLVEAATKPREAGVAVTVYDSVDEVGLGVERYTLGWVARSGLGVEVVVVAGYLLDLFLTKNAKMSLTKHNRHRILASAFTIATKYLTDHPRSNTFYASISGVALAEVNRLERTFLCDLEFAVYISGEKYNAYKAQFVMWISKSRRGGGGSGVQAVET